MLVLGVLTEYCVPPRAKADLKKLQSAGGGLFSSLTSAAESATGKARSPEDGKVDEVALYVGNLETQMTNVAKVRVRGLGCWETELGGTGRHLRPVCSAGGVGAPARALSAIVLEPGPRLGPSFFSSLSSAPTPIPPPPPWQHTAALMKRGKELSTGLYDFGLAFTLLGQHESEALTGALSQMGHTADQLSLITTDQVEKEQRWFEEPIGDYLQVGHGLGQGCVGRFALVDALALLRCGAFVLSFLGCPFPGAPRCPS